MRSTVPHHFLPIGGVLLLAACEGPAGEPAPFPPPEAPDGEVVQGLRFLDRMRDELRADLRMTLCTLPDRAARLLDVASGDSVDTDRARGLVERADQLEEALTALVEGTPRYVRGMRVSATVADVRRAATEPGVGSVRRAFTPDDEEALLVPTERDGEPDGRTRPDTTEARTRGDVDPARIRARLQSVARGYEGCGVSGPRS